MDRLNIRHEMSCLDRKDRTFYDTLTDEERKKFSPYLMIRWSRTVAGSDELQGYYVQACNHYLNHDFFAVNRHPKLQWLMATAVSPGLGRQDHSWIPPKKKEGTSKKSGDVIKRLSALYPAMKHDDIVTLSRVITPQELSAYEHDLGN